MSLVVLRSWSDGQPPKIRGIAPPDSDDKNEIVVPDHQGRFVTAEAPKVIQRDNTRDVNRERFVKSNSSVADSQRPNSRVGKYWNRKSLPSPSSLSSNSLSPSPTNKLDLDGDRQKLDKIILSRESSLQSLPSTDPDSSPSSPVCGNSRYKNLGPELAATIPKRQIIRDTWVRDSYSIFRKKELSKSTPSLNLGPEDEDHLDLEGVESRPESVRGRRSSALDKIGGTGSKSGYVTAWPRPRSFLESESSKSWQDIVYGGEFEPRFGDKPASVVGVIKKGEIFTSSGGSDSPVPDSTHKSTDLPSNPDTRVSPPRPNSFYTTTSPVSPTFPPKVSPIFSRDSTSGASGSDSACDDGASRSFPFANLAPNPDLRRVKRAAKKAIRSVSFELDLHLNKVGSNLTSSSTEFPVYRAVHSNPASVDVEVDKTDKEEKVVDVDAAVAETRQSPKIPDPPPELSGDEDEIDLELDALRVETSSSGGESERENNIFKENQSGQGKKADEDGDEAKGEMQNQRKSSEESAAPRRETNKNSHGHGNKNGSASVQVPVQCVNRHVIIPTNPPTKISSTPDPIKSSVIQNGDYSEDEEFINNGKNNLRRKNFCDDLLSNVVLQVPPLPLPPPPPIMTMESPMSPINGTDNHDGIIIFDEEDEFEGSETDSIALSEQENSFEYLSVFQNVKVGSPIENKTRTTEPQHIIGLDFGSTYSRHCALDKSTGEIEFGDAFRALVTSDGLAHGASAIYHSMATKSKLIYKWRARQTFPYDPYDDEDNSSILEVLFKHYARVLRRKLGPRAERERPGSPDEESESSSVQWNVSIQPAMDKKAVREAAFSSGLVKSTDELRLVNESTAAAVLACKLLKTQRKGAESTFLNVNIGSTYFHTSGYHFSGDGNLHVREAGVSQTFQTPESLFIELLARVFSREFLLKYESRFTPSWVEILIRFEEMKDNYIKSGSECYLFFPISFFLEFYKCTGIQVPECIEENPDEGIVWDNNGAIRFPKDLMDEWLQPTLNFITARSKNKSYDAIVLSGGGANEILRRELADLVAPSVQVYLLDNPEKAVVQGLVGLDDIKLTIKSPFSIGVGVMTPFDGSVHPPEKRVIRKGKEWCSDVWDNLIRKGQSMIMGEVVLKRTYQGAQPEQNVLVLPIFKSDLEEPKLVSSPRVEKCCELRFEINKEKSWREVRLVIKCCDHELIIIATGNDGDVSHVVIDF